MRTMSTWCPGHFTSNNNEQKMASFAFAHFSIQIVNETRFAKNEEMGLARTINVWEH